MSVALSGVIQHLRKIELHNMNNARMMKTCPTRIAKHVSCTIYAVILNEESAVRRIVRPAAQPRITLHSYLI